MRKDTGQTIDFSKFDRTFFPLVKIIFPTEAGKGLFEAANEMLRDGDNEPPQTPFKHGDLRGSKKVEKPKVTAGAISVEAGYNIKYATKLHESDPAQYRFVPRKGILSPGRKWLETKMARHKEKYIKIAGLKIKSKGK